MLELILEHAAPLIEAASGWLDARATLARAEGYAIAAAATALLLICAGLGIKVARS